MATVAALLLLGLATLSPGAEPASADAVVELPAEVRADLQERLGHVRGPEQRLRLLFDFVFDADGLALQYGGDSTLTARESLQARTANCLTFSLLFVALAREAGLNAYVQEIEQVLVWHEQSGLVYNAGHANAGVRIGPRRFSVDINRSLVLAASSPRALSDAEALARYYNNRGVELMAAGALPEAGRHYARALELAPQFAGLHNNLGVLASRENRLEAARAHFQAALEYRPESSAALFNLVGLHQRLGDAGSASAYQARLDRLHANDPFHQYLLGDAFERQGELAAAADHYRRAIRLQRDQHLFHFGLARVYARSGDAARARTELIRARNLADEDRRPLYQAKLDSLQSATGSLR